MALVSGASHGVLISPSCRISRLRNSSARTLQVPARGLLVERLSTRQRLDKVTLPRAGNGCQFCAVCRQCSAVHGQGGHRRDGEALWGARRLTKRCIRDSPGIVYSSTTDDLSVADAAETTGVVDKASTSLEQEGNVDGAHSSALTPGLVAILEQCRTWNWQGHAINYVVQGKGPPVVLVHGFGASIGHYRKNIPVLSEDYTVYAIDLLGFGASDKPEGYTYTVESWGQLLLAFLDEVVAKPAVLVGNSIGSLSVLYASAEAAGGQVQGSILLNCAGGMNNKAVVDDWRLKLVLPLFWLIDWLLLQPRIARSLFKSFSSAGNVRNVLASVYSNKAAVDDELVEVILRPAGDPGALHCFVSVITGPPGPRPEALLPRIPTPVLVLWGDEDPFTPVDGPIGKYFRALPASRDTVKFVDLPDSGHCPHDDNYDAVHQQILPWLKTVFSL